MRWGVVVFPGTNCDFDTHHVLDRVLGQQVRYVWHQEQDLGGLDAVVLPGGFSYGDYLRTGAIARFSPVMAAVERHARAGGLVLGICNGFQILCEAGLLPGALHRNRRLKFQCERTYLRVERNDLPFTRRMRPGEVLAIPINHGEGNYYAGAEELREMQEAGQVVFRYATPAGDANAEANPNGSVANIAGVCNRRGNVLGLMPHPERASEAVLGSEDGRRLFLSMIDHLEAGR